MANENPMAVVNDVIENAFKELIDSKHLYQSVIIKWGALEPRIHLAPHNVARAAGRRYLRESRWDCIGQVTDTVARGNVPFVLPPVKTFCARCEELHPHNLDRESSFTFCHDTFCDELPQTFCLTLRCQGCRSASVTFLIVRRNTQDRVKLTLAGRSEFEQIDVPTYIPREQRRFYSGAVIAYNSGQFLPALFMLRTLIEQHMRATVEDKSLRGDDLCEAYAATLERDFKDRFPSFGEVYAELSEAIHEARDDEGAEELFRLERGRIELHFRAKAVFEE